MNVLPIEIWFIICGFSPRTYTKLLTVSKFFYNSLSPYEAEFIDTWVTKKVVSTKQYTKKYDTDCRYFSPEKYDFSYPAISVKYYYSCLPGNIYHGEHKTTIDLNPPRSKKRNEVVTEAYHYRLGYKHGKFVINQYEGKEIELRITGNYRWNKLSDKLRIYTRRGKGMNLWKEYDYENGEMKLYSEYSNIYEVKSGKYYGYKSIYYLSFKEYWSNNIITKRERYHPNGNLSYTVSFRDGREHGTATYYNPDGELEHNEEWINGNRVVR